MTDYRTAKLHAIFDNAKTEYTVHVACPYNIFGDVIRKRVETALSLYGLTSLEEEKHIPTSTEVHDYFPHIEVGPVYILKAKVERVHASGVQGLLNDVAQFTGYPNYNLKVWVDGVDEEEQNLGTEKKEAYLDYEPGEHPDETMLTPEQAAALHGPKRIAALMQHMARSDEEKYGKYAAETFAASSAVLKEMFNKPFKKGAYKCVAAGGEVTVEDQITLEETANYPYFTEVGQINEFVENTKHRTFLESIVYEATNNPLTRQNIYHAITGAKVPCDMNSIKVDLKTSQAQVTLGVAWLHIDTLLLVFKALKAAGIAVNNPIVGIEEAGSTGLMLAWHTRSLADVNKPVEPVVPDAAAE